ncbi:hypothetical protein FD755_017186 [Muntiacus reevesi]|uniref:Uncharacterized protein n=1 Tax=Muntiacus reevesi TaxID=9886 RepID=A0A5N3XC42_MUNRE|nr:hypothetical protein FD755_017186 [Muntiacus reevesi]
MAFAVIRARSRVGWSRLYKRRAGPPRGRRRQRRRRAPRSSAPPTPPSSGAPRPPTGPPPPRSRFGSPARRAPGCCLPGGPGAAAAPGEPRRPAGRPRRRRPRHGGRQARRADGHLLQLPGGDAALRVPGRRVPAAHAARQAVQGQGPAAAAPPVPFQDAAGDLRRDPGGGGGGGVPDGGGEGQEVHAEPVAAEGAAQRLQTEEQPGLQRLRLGPVTCAARSRDSRAQAARRDGPACEPRGGPRAPHLGVPHPPSTPVGGPPGPSPDCELVRAPGAELAPAGSARRGAGAPGKGGAAFLCPCKCLFFNSSQYELCCECVRGGAPALSRRGSPGLRGESLHALVRWSETPIFAHRSTVPTPSPRAHTRSHSRRPTLAEHFYNC